jgi:hypothetical protein
VAFTLILASALVVSNGLDPTRAAAYPEGNLSSCLSDNNDPPHLVTWRTEGEGWGTSSSTYPYTSWANTVSQWQDIRDYDDEVLVDTQRDQSNGYWRFDWVDGLDANTLGGVGCGGDKLSVGRLYWTSRQTLAQAGVITAAQFETEFKAFLQHEFGHIVGLRHTQRTFSATLTEPIMGTCFADPAHPQAISLDDRQSLYAYLSADEPFGMEPATWNNSFEGSTLGWSLTSGSWVRSNATASSGTDYSLLLSASGPYVSQTVFQETWFMPNEEDGNRTGQKFRGRASVRGRTTSDIGPFRLEMWAQQRDYPASPNNTCGDSEYEGGAFDGVDYSKPSTSIGQNTLRAQYSGTLSPSGSSPIPSTQWRTVNTPEWTSTSSWDAVDVQIRFINATFNGCCTGGQVYTDLVRLLEGD